MEASSPLLNLPQLSNLSNHSIDRSCPESGKSSLHSTNELIANLDHELWNVRLRALKCILQKVECSIVTTEFLSRRIDLLNRLSDWLRATTEADEETTTTSPRGRGWSVNIDVAVQGIPYVLRLLCWLSEFDSVKQFIVDDKLEPVLTKLKPIVNEETKILLEKLIDQIFTSIEFKYEGSPEVWNDNASNNSLRKNTSTEKSYSYEDKADDGMGDGDLIFTRFDRIPETNMSHHSAGGESYFPNQSLQSVLDKTWPSGFNFSIPSVHLAGTDRRVLASTVESLLTKNENLVFTTCCFFRDVLLQDYPPEVFVQESSICMAIFEIAESPWNDIKVAHAATQGLLSLSSVLRTRIAQLNCSEFYETKRQTIVPNQYSGISSFSSQIRNSSITTDTFSGTICQLLKGLSRTLLFHPTEFNLWKLLDSFSLTICKCAHTFPLDYKILSLGLQEVLLDLAYCYEKHNEVVNSPVLATCSSSILKALQIDKQEFVLAYDVRQCIRKLSRCSRLLNGWPEVHQYFWKMAAPLVENLNPADIDTVGRENEEFTMSKAPHEIEYHPQDDISKLLLAVQNATSHQVVIQAIEQMWVLVYPLVINTRLNEGIMDYIYRDVPWRDAFYRFLCVEPTCVEDEDLLIKVLDLTSHLISNMGTSGRAKLEEWIVPLCMENGCALLKLLNVHCLKPETPCSGTMLPSILRSLFDFYFNVMKKSSLSSHSEFKWNMFKTLCMIFHQFGDREYSSPAVLLPVMKGLATFSSLTEIKSQLLQNSKFCIALIHRINESIIFLQERSGGLSEECYRNQGVLYYLSLSLYHMVTYVSKTERLPSSDWIGTCCALIPYMWDSRDTRIRALGYQISDVLSCRVQGVISLMSILETPSTIWTNSYHSLMNAEESAIVKQYAASTLCNLIEVWDEVERSTHIGNSLQLPFWPILDDVSKLLAHVYWLPTLSEIFQSVDTLHNENDSSHVQLVTPKVVTMICKMLMKMQNTSIPQFHPEPFVTAVCSSGICPVLFRLVGTHSVSEQLEKLWLIDSCYALSSVVEALIMFCQLDRGISLMLIGDKHSLISLVQLLNLQEIPDQSKLPDQILSTLCVNVFTLLTLLCSDAGNNFEDFERCISNQRNTIFTWLTKWLKPDSLAKCRKIALHFSHELLSRLTMKQQEQETDKSLKKDIHPTGHPILCREWKNKTGTYGTSLCESLILVYEDSTVFEVKQDVLRTLCALSNLSPSAKTFAIEHNLIGILTEKLKDFGKKYYDFADSFQIGRKNNNQWMVETINILSLMSSLVYKEAKGKKSALFHDVIDTFHKIFKFWKTYPDRTLLHAFLETSLNFTEEFPPGCQALTLSSNVLGVGPRKAPTLQCFLFEILEILQTELGLNEACNLRSVELIFELLKNASFVIEGRNILLKSPAFQFLTFLHVREMKKWGPKQHNVKLFYLEFLLHVSMHPDMQTAIAKIPSAIEILVPLVDFSDSYTSLLGLKIIRNLSFQATNRTRLLCDDTVMPSLSAKIRDSDNLEEIECAAVGLWALIANSEKGKLSAKKCLCRASVSRAINRFRKIEQSSNDLLTKKQDLSNLINILNALSSILGVPPSQSVQSLND